MISLKRKQKEHNKSSRIYLIVRFWWVTKMNMLTKGFSKSQLRFSLFIFTVFGTVLCTYTVLRGFLADSPQLIRIDAVTVLEPDYKDHKIEMNFLEVPIKKYAKQSNLSRYIDSVLNAADLGDLSKYETLSDKYLISSPTLEQTN